MHPSSLAVVRSVAMALTLGMAAVPQTATAQSPREGRRLELAQACGWYAIFQCGKNPNLGGPGYVIVTNDFPNFRPGWYCKVLGPFGTQWEAANTARQGGGYAKSAC